MTPPITHLAGTPPIFIGAAEGAGEETDWFPVTTAATLSVAAAARV